MRYARSAEVVYRSGFTAALVTVIATVWVLAAVSFVVSGDEQAVFFVVMCVTALPLISIGHLRVRVVLRSEEVVLYNTFKRKTVRYDEIAEAVRTKVGFANWTVIIHHTDGATITRLPMFMEGQAPITTWHNNLATEINLRSEAARGTHGRG